MINFIVYETNARIRNNYELMILNFIGNREEKFKIFTDQSQTNNNNNIYIISNQNIKTALKIATSIRKNNDWKSQIIIISNIKGVKKELLINNLLILDYIDNNENYYNKLKEDLYIAYKILTTDKTLNYNLNNEINKIPYKDILYIEKNNNQNYCTIYTENNEYIVKETINNLEKQLDKAIFMKTHRSCIVNLHNINHYNCSQNIITFSNKKEIDLISRDKRKILKSRLINNMISE